MGEKVLEKNILNSEFFNFLKLLLSEKIIGVKSIFMGKDDKIIPVVQR